MRTVFLFFFIFLSYLLSAQNNLNSEAAKKQQVKLEVSEVKMSVQQAEIKRCYPTEEYLIQNNVPEDFPRYKDTGNPKQDCARYHEAKQEWIRNNPERYEKIKHLNL